MNEKFFSNKYQVNHEIARGGMGTIYLATDTKLGREVAIKMLHPQYSGEQAFAQRFLREARAMAKLDHPNIIRIWSVEEEEGSYYIVMEYFPGNDLKQIIRSRGLLPIPEALSLTTQIIQGLAYAHIMGIIHRDIKPANILVDQAGKVKITDFGIAAAFSESSLTVDGTVLGTPEYMAPEQARAENVGPHSDLYSVGILLYELLTGQTPYKGIPAQSLVVKLAFGSENPVLTFPPTIPGELQDLITKMTQKPVEDRLTDIDEILSVLKSEFPASPAEKQDEDTTEVYPPNDPSERSAGPPDKTFVQDRSISPQDKTDNLADIPSDLPPLNDDSESYHERHPLISPQTRKLIISAIGILAFVGIFVLVLSQWPTKDFPLPTPNGTVHQPDNRDKVETAIGNIQQISQNIQATQKEISKEFKSFSLAIQSLHGEINDKKIPLKYSDAQHWLDKKKKEVQTLVQEHRKFENSQKSLMVKSMEGFIGSKQQGEQLLQQDLSQDQQKQLNEATTNLKKTQQALETTFAKHLQNTQNLFANLHSELKKSEQTILSRKKTPSGESTPPKAAPNKATQLVNLKTEILSIDQEIENMLKTFEASALDFTSQLSNLQTEIKQIDVSLDPNSTLKLEGFKDNVRTIQQEAQALFSQKNSQKQKLHQSIQATAQNYRGISKTNLDTFQQANLSNLNEILKKNQSRLEAFPPDSWKQLQALALNIQTLLTTTEKALDQYTQDQKTKEEQIADLALKTARLATSIQEFRSQTSLQYHQLTQQVATTGTQVDSLPSQAQMGTLEDSVAKLQDSLGKLQETITQHSGTHDQQSQSFAQRQAEIEARLKKLIQSPLASPLEQQVSQLRKTLQSIEKDIQDLNQVDWRALEAKWAATLNTFNNTKESLEPLKKILNNFNIAYEKRDLLNLKLTTSISESRARNLSLMFKNYTTIDTHTEIVSISESQAKVKIIIDKLINKEGENITPNFIIRETTITIPKKDGKWGKIQW